MIDPDGRAVFTTAAAIALIAKGLAEGAIGLAMDGAIAGLTGEAFGLGAAGWSFASNGVMGVIPYVGEAALARRAGKLLKAVAQHSDEALKMMGPLRQMADKLGDAGKALHSKLDDIAGTAGKGADDAAAGAGKASGGGADFVVTEGGTAVPTSQSRMREGFDNAGFESRPTQSPGVEHTLPNGQRVRTMEPSEKAPRPASFENSNGQPVTPDGTVPQPPQGMSRSGRRQWVRDRTHVEQDR